MLGKTGCGKSTIFNLIAGLAEPTAGSVAVDGHDPFKEFDDCAARSASCSRATG